MFSISILLLKIKRYLHCAAHKLNLALQAACTHNTQIRKCCGTVSSVYDYIGGSNKRHAIFINMEAEEVSDPETLKNHCATRWTSRERSFDSLYETYEYVLKTLLHKDKPINHQMAQVHCLFTKASPLMIYFLFFAFYMK